VGRQRAAGFRGHLPPGDERSGTGTGSGTARQALESIDTSPVGFAVFDRVLITVHPPDCAVRERELLRVRSRDVLEHVERVLSHVRRLGQSAETAVQMHFCYISARGIFTRRD
jgi:hypothetical protein